MNMNAYCCNGEGKRKDRRKVIWIRGQKCTYEMSYLSFSCVFWSRIYHSNSWGHEKVWFSRLSNFSKITKLWSGSDRICKYQNVDTILIEAGILVITWYLPKENWEYDNPKSQDSLCPLYLLLFSLQTRFSYHNCCNTLLANPPTLNLSYSSPYTPEL